MPSRGRGRYFADGHNEPQKRNRDRRNGGTPRNSSQQGGNAYGYSSTAVNPSTPTKFRNNYQTWGSIQQPSASYSSLATPYVFNTKPWVDEKIKAKNEDYPGFTEEATTTHKDHQTRGTYPQYVVSGVAAPDLETVLLEQRLRAVRQEIDMMSRNNENMYHSSLNGVLGAADGVQLDDEIQRREVDLRRREEDLLARERVLDKQRQRQKTAKRLRTPSPYENKRIRDSRSSGDRNHHSYSQHVGSSRDVASHRRRVESSPPRRRIRSDDRKREIIIERRNVATKIPEKKAANELTRVRPVKKRYVLSVGELVQTEVITDSEDEDQLKLDDRERARLQFFAELREMHDRAAKHRREDEVRFHIARKNGLEIPDFGANGGEVNVELTDGWKMDSQDLEKINRYLGNPRLLREENSNLRPTAASSAEQEEAVQEQQDSHVEQISEDSGDELRAPTEPQKTERAAVDMKNEIEMISDDDAELAIASNDVAEAEDDDFDLENMSFGEVDDLILEAEDEDEEEEESKEETELRPDNAEASNFERSTRVKRRKKMSDVWEGLRKKARSAENSIDVKLVSLNKLNSHGGFDVDEKTATSRQALFRTLTADLESLISQLTEINDEMNEVVGAPSASTWASNPAIQHTVRRHREILRDYGSEFRRARDNVEQVLQRELLLSGGKDSSDGSCLNNRVKGYDMYLKEHDHISSCDRLLDEQMSIALNTKENLSRQSINLRGISSRINSIAKKYPALNGIMQRIQSKKRKNTLVLAAVISACLIFTIFYIIH